MNNIEQELKKVLSILEKNIFDRNLHFFNRGSTKNILFGCKTPGFSKTLFSW